MDENKKVSERLEQLAREYDEQAKTAVSPFLVVTLKTLAQDARSKAKHARLSEP